MVQQNWSSKVPGGLIGMIRMLNKKLNSLTEIDLNIAVTGRTGSGKSSLINAIRHIKPKQDGAAEFGALEETTKKCTHPDNKSFVLWDLPGVGTENFPRKSYLEMVNFGKYDFFIIVSKDRFTEDDLWLAKEVAKQKKRFYFVLSNIDKNIAVDMRDNPDHEEKEFLKLKRAEIEEKLQSYLKDKQNVFLVDNYERDQYDFSRLNTEMLSSCDGLKKDALALSHSALSKKNNDEKKRELESRIHLVALRIASTADKKGQKEVFEEEINFYKNQFEVDDKTLSENKEILSLTNENMNEFHVVFDFDEHDAGIRIRTPTALRKASSVWSRFADSFHRRKEKTLLYKFSKNLLENNLEIIYQKSKAFYDETVENMLSAYSQ